MSDNENSYEVERRQRIAKNKAQLSVLGVDSCRSHLDEVVKAKSTKQRSNPDPPPPPRVRLERAAKARGQDNLLATAAASSLNFSDCEFAPESTTSSFISSEKAMEGRSIASGWVNFFKE